MKKIWLIFAQIITISLVLLSILFIVQKQYDFSFLAKSTPKEQPFGFQKAIKEALPCAVKIYTAQKTKSRKKAALSSQPLSPSLKARNSTLGSGVIIRSDGFIITSRHVVQQAEQIEVVLSDQTIFDAVLVGTDRETDLAVIKIAATGLPAIPFNLVKPLQIGDMVLAIGNPFGVGQTVSFGIISALKRAGLNLSAFEDFIQTDAVINPGSSGGALINLSGQLVGINSNIMSDTGSYMGIGFAVPATTVNKIAAEIIQTGTVTRGWLGLQGQDIATSLSEYKEGVLITRILRGQPAYISGLRVKDILLTIDDRPVKHFKQMLRYVSCLSPGTTVQVTFLRQKKHMTTRIIIGKRPNA